MCRTFFSPNIVSRLRVCFMRAVWVHTFLRYSCQVALVFARSASSSSLTLPRAHSETLTFFSRMTPPWMSLPPPQSSKASPKSSSACHNPTCLLVSHSGHQQLCTSDTVADCSRVWTGWSGLSPCLTGACCCCCSSTSCWKTRLTQD
jgi:hypothetical protein